MEVNNTPYTALNDYRTLHRKKLKLCVFIRVLLTVVEYKICIIMNRKPTSHLHLIEKGKYNQCLNNCNSPEIMLGNQWLRNTLWDTNS